MPSSGLPRLLVVISLLAVLFGLCVLYGALEPDPSVGAYPDGSELGTDYDRYVGERVSVGGEIVDTDPVVIEVEYGVDEVIRLRVVELDNSVGVAEGDYLRVYGVVEPDRTVRALNVFVVPQTGRWYTWSVSFLAGLWVLGRLVRHWQFDREAWVLCRRDRPLRAPAWLRSRPIEEADRDA